ncbi:hypothetical protein [Pedobacter punctiformis]|uniref:Uncharacterized protein n=1 Tax=Pedobacter punctiformis TaxID=3004097 RepID=A0ABT4L4B2_9SPHI|nr:hypothetical protein [Pedobacter sp. HCMS5-2]MCZ4242770.1 hypothetical protein [Pedobacter sp. HCMS5-2]
MQTTTDKRERLIIIQNIKAVSYNADYLYWFKLDKPVKDLIFIREFNESDPERKREKPYFRKITKIGEVTNKFSREYGTSVFLLEDANIDLNKILRSEIKEEQNDN